MGTPTLARPLKVGNVHTYVDEVNALAPADAPILAPEVDADLDTLYNAWNNPASAFPPTGNAGGDLAGSSYPSPIIGALKVTDAKINDVAWAKITGAPTSFPPSGAATGDLQGSYPAPSVIPAAKSKWSVSGSTITPVDATKSVTIPGAPGETGSALVLGTRTVRFRAVTDLGGNDWAGWKLNNAAAPEVPAQSSWMMSLSSTTDTSDSFLVQRRAPGAAVNAVANLLMVDGAGKLTLPGPGSGNTTGGALVLGTRTAKLRALTDLSGGDWCAWTLNNTYAPEVPAQSSWALNLSSTTDASDGFIVQRRAPGAAAGAVVNVLTVDGNGNLGVTGGSNLFGPGPVRATLQAAGSDVSIFLNSPWALQDPAKCSWITFMGDTSRDLWEIGRRAAGQGAGAWTSLFYISNAGNMNITGATATKASGTTWANPSDDRIKKDAQPYTRGLAAILALDPITFRFNGKGGSQDGMPGIGFSAQAVQPVMPEMVLTRPTKLDPDDETPVDLLVLETTALPLALVNAVKELAARVAALEGVG